MLPWGHNTLGQMLLGLVQEDRYITVTAPLHYRYMLLDLVQEDRVVER